jgi:hypothetical protein
MVVCILYLYVRYICCAFLCCCQRPDNGYALLNIDCDGLLGDPAVLVLQDFQRHLSVALKRCRVQYLGQGFFTVGFAFLRCHLGDGVQHTQLPVFSREHSSGEGQRVALQADLGCVVDAVKRGLCGLHFAD